MKPWFALAFFAALHTAPAAEQPGVRKTPLSIAPDGKTGFTILDQKTTGIAFENQVREEDSLALMVIADGSGVALGDFDNDGRCDVFAVGLSSQCKLYKNLGSFKFSDVTDGSGLTGIISKDWYGKGACFADVNGDGNLDLVVTLYRSNPRLIGSSVRIWLGNGKGAFTETTASSGLVSNLGPHSVSFSDVDGDGDLDLYVTNFREHSIAGAQIKLTGSDAQGRRYTVYRTVISDGTVVQELQIPDVNGKPVIPEKYKNRLSIQADDSLLDSGEPDQLYLNDGKGKFAPVSWTGGKFLNEDGKPLTDAPRDFGLAVRFADFNGDGHPDMYVSNDIQTPDRFWFGDGKGSFRAAPRLAIRSTSYASMGVDVADINRDGVPDLYAVDMLSRTHAGRKRSMGLMRPTPVSIGEIENRPQLMRNTLQLGRGDGTWAEIAPYAGLTATEWSWQPIFLDVDLDGWEDLFVTNGFERNTLDSDVSAIFNTQKLKTIQQRFEVMKLFPTIDPPKVAFRNRGDLTFEETAAAWGLDAKGIAHGVAEADLDGDGDLDLVVNMYRAPLAIYRNNTSAPRVAVSLHGTKGNGPAIGAKVTLKGGALPEQSREVFLGGRYLSGADPLLCFAAGKSTSMSLEVIWPNGKRTEVKSVLPNHRYDIGIESATAPEATAPKPIVPLFADGTRALGHEHTDIPFDDFARQTLLPNRLSQMGPGLAAADLNGDGLDDLVIGASVDARLGVRFGKLDGSFDKVANSALTADADAAGVLAWRTPDGGMRLHAALSNFEDENATRGSVHAWELAKSLSEPLVPGERDSAGPIAVADVDGDGDLDLFVGGRTVPGRYPEPPRSRLFKNEGGKYTLDEANTKALADVGMVSGAVFTDILGDRRPELVLACEWGPIRVFANEGGSYVEKTKELGLSDFTGWWNGVTTGDFDGDGRQDIVATNWGNNTKYHTSPGHPLLVYFGEFQKPGRLDIIESHFDKAVGALVPERGFSCSSTAMPFLRDTIKSYKDFGESNLEQLYGEKLKTARSLSAATLEHAVFLNRSGKFERIALPTEAQLSTSFGVSVADFDGDGNEDIAMAQNFFAAQIETPRSDAGRSLILLGKGDGHFTAMPGQNSGVLVYGDARGLAVGDFNGDRRPDLAVAQNGAATRLFTNKTGQPGLRIDFQGPAENPALFGTVVRLKINGKYGPAREVHGGSGYWSQDAPAPILAIPTQPEAIAVRLPNSPESVLPMAEPLERLTIKP